MAQPYPVVGIENTGIHPRLELRDLQKNSIQFSLFIRALNKVLDMRNIEDEHSSDYIDKPNSWWQMGSIHGLPYTPWSGDPTGPRKPNQASVWGGYCYHGSALFPSWHRILVLLIEQSVVNEAIAIATDLGGRYPHWLQAAKELRFPFWDWTKLETAKEGIPLILQLPTIEIVNPDGSFVEVNNPLNHYRFTLRPGATEGFEYMGNWDRTYRWVNDLYQPTKERYTRAHDAFSKGLLLRVPGSPRPWELQPVDWLRAKVAALFNYPLTLPESGATYGPNVWGLFATTGTKRSDKIYIPPEVQRIFGEAPPNIEEPHNKVHLDIGGIGSMSMNEYAGFDPIFFLHHCNIDRIYSFWEYVYPNYSIESGWKNERGETVPFKVDEYGNFVQDPFATEDHNTPFVPFRVKDVRYYWTSDSTRSLLNTAQTKKYYTYPAIPVPGSDEKVKVDVPYNVGDLALRERYRQALYNEWGLSLIDTVAGIQEFTKAASPALNPQLRSHLLDENDTVSHLRNFIITGEVPEFAFPGSYHLQLYLRSEVTKEATPLVINSISVLARANPEKCAACKDRQAAGNQIRGYMHLDPIIVLYLISLLNDDPKGRWPNLPAASTSLTAGDPLDLNFLTNLIKSSVGVRLVRPDGAPLAIPDSQASVNVASEEVKAPRLTLYSNRIGFNLGQATYTSIDIKFEEAADHGEIPVGGGWKVLPNFRW